MIKYLITLLTLPLFFGCAYFNDKPEYRFPKDIEGDCYHAVNTSKSGIEKVDGKKLEIIRDLTIQKIKGTKKISGMWCWQAPQFNNMYIGGLCSGSYIKVGCNPQTEGEVAFNVIFHETGHYWIMSNYGLYNHPAKYDSVFNWSYCDTLLGRSTVESLKTIYDEGKTISVYGEDTNGVKYHIDFVVDE